MINKAAIFPRFYPVLPKVGEADVTLSHDDSPVEREFAADIIIWYGIDKGSTYEIISYKTQSEMGVSSEDLHSIAVQNLTKTEKEIKIHKGTGYSLITCDGSLEASLLLHEGIWSYISDEIGGSVVASIPARDVLLVTGTEPEMVSVLKKKTCELLEYAERPLSLALFTLTNIGWQEYRSEPCH